MTLALITAASLEPVSLAEMKAHLRLVSDAEDALLGEFIKAAREHVERQTRRCLLGQVWRLYLDRWPQGRVVPFPIGPVQSVEQIVLYDRQGASVLLTPADWSVARGTDPARLRVALGAGLPHGQLDGIEIDVRCGYGSAASDVPETLRQSVRLLAAHWFENREAGTELAMASLPHGLDRLLSVNRMPRL